MLCRGLLDRQGLKGVELRGHDGFRQVVAAARSSFERLDVTLEDIVSEEDNVVTLRWDGRREDGTSLMRETIDLLHPRDSRVVEHWGAQFSS